MPQAIDDVASLEVSSMCETVVRGDCANEEVSALE